MTATRPYAMALMLSAYWSEVMRALISNGGMTVGEFDRMIELKRALDLFRDGRDARWGTTSSDRGASIEVIAEMWGLERHTISNAVRGRSFCQRETCDLPDRSGEYRARLKAAKDSGSVDTVLLEQYRSNIRQRKAKERAQCRAKAMENRVDGNKGPSEVGNPFSDGGKKGVVS